jgi:hypothetical protein
MSGYIKLATGQEQELVIINHLLDPGASSEKLVLPSLAIDAR